MADAAMKKEPRKCWCPIRPLYTPGSFGSGSSHEVALMDRWFAEHGAHPYAQARDDLAKQLQIAESEVGSGEAALRMVHEIMGIPVPELSGGELLTESEVARRKLKAASARAQAADGDVAAAQRELSAAEARERAANFQPNATMVEDYLGLFSMNATNIDPIIPKGARVHVQPGKYDFDDWTVTAQDGRQHQLGPSYFERDPLP